MLTVHKALLVAMLGGACTSLLFEVVRSAPAVADGNPQTDGVPRVVTYDGTLELDGVAYSGTVEMVFQLFDGASSPTAIWTEEYRAERAVSVFSGAFQVALGTHAAGIDTAISRADDLYLAVSIVGEDGTLVPLAGRQRFTPAPYALWAARGADFTIARDARIERNLAVIGTSTMTGATTINGATTVNNSATINGNLSVNGSSTTTGTVTTGNIAMNGVDLIMNNIPGRGGGRALVNDAADTLVMNFSNDFAGGTRIDGSVNVGTNLTAGGSLRATSYTPGFARADSAPTGDGGASIVNDNNGFNALVVTGNNVAGGGSGAKWIVLRDNVIVSGTQVVNGDFIANDCRMCLYWSDLNDAGTRNYTCVRMNGEMSTPLQLGGTVGNDDRLRLSFQCDGGATTSGTW